MNYESKRPFNKDGNPRKRMDPSRLKVRPRKEHFVFAEGFVPLNDSASGALRYRLNRYQVPAKTDHFVLGLDWADVWGDWERFPAILIRSLLILVGSTGEAAPFAQSKRLTLQALTYLFSERGKIGKLCPSRKEGISPGYVVYCVSQLVSSDNKEWSYCTPADGLVLAAQSKTVLLRGVPATPFEAGEELALVLRLAGADNLWKQMAGIKLPEIECIHDNLVKRAILSSVARMTWEIGRPGRSLFCKSKYLDRGKNQHDAKRVARLLDAIDNPEDVTLESVAELVAVRDWMLENRSKFLRVFLRPGGERLVNCGAAAHWLTGDPLPLVANAVG